MKIAYVMMDFPVDSETFACNDVRMLANMGHEVDVFSLMAHSQKKTRTLEARGLQKSNVQVFYFPGNKATFIRTFLNRPIYLLKHAFWSIFSKFQSMKQRLKHVYYAVPCAFHFDNTIKHMNYDVIHFFWGHYPVILADLLLKNKKSIQKLSLFLGAADLSYKLPITRKVAPLFKTVFTHSMENLEELRSLGIKDSNIRLVYRGIDVDDLNLSPQTPKDQNLWVTAGRLIATKRFDLVIEAFSRAAAVHPEISLCIVGSGPDEYRLKRLTEKLNIISRVTFISWIPHKEMITLLSKAGFLFLLSQKPGERLPNVVKEAMYMRCVCIVGRESGCSELITHEKDGFICDTEEVNSTLDNLLSCDNLDYIRDAARKKILNSFSLKTSMSQYIDEWNKLIKK